MTNQEFMDLHISPSSAGCCPNKERIKYGARMRRASCSESASIQRRNGRADRSSRETARKRYWYLGRVWIGLFITTTVAPVDGRTIGLMAMAIPASVTVLNHMYWVYGIDSLE